MKFNKILTAVASLMVIGAASCTDDWDNHYGVATQGNGASLWEVITANPELSNFAEVVKATGYDKSLASSQMFTVFAPTNSEFTTAERDAVIAKYQADLAKGLRGDKNSGIKEFVQNHIALYNYSVAPETEDRSLRMMNGKYVHFTNHSFAGKEFLSSNTVTGNGVLYTISDEAEYAFNLYEYIKVDESLDSVAKFLSHYDFENFQPSLSVPGEIVNGKQHYLDSVTVTTNEILTRWIEARLDSEDSLYYALCPTNEAWKEQLERNQKLFTYASTVAERDSFEYIYPRVFILAGAQFSKSRNPKLGTTEQLDSVMSPLAVDYQYREIAFGSADKKYYQFDKPYAADGIFANTTQRECSNGMLLKADEWKIDGSNTFIKDILMEAEGRNTLDSLSGEDRKSKPDWIRRRVPVSNPLYKKVSGQEFYSLKTNTATSPAALFDFTDVLANQEYDMYVVSAPMYAADTLTTDTLPTMFSAKVYWREVDGTEKELAINNTSASAGSVQIADGDIFLDNAYQNSTKMYLFKTAGKDVAEIKIGTFKFPTCSYNLPNPEVKLYLEVQGRKPSTKEPNAGFEKTISQTLHIDAIKLVPRMSK